MNKTVLITGASRGIGRAIAFAFAKAGNRLIITCSKSSDDLLSVQRELEDCFHIEVLASVGDLTDYTYVEQLFAQTMLKCSGT